MGKGMRFAGIRLLISLTPRANAGKATFRGKTAGRNSSPKVGEVPERRRGMKQPTLLIPLTRTGSSPTLGEQLHPDGNCTICWLKKHSINPCYSCSKTLWFLLPHFSIQKKNLRRHWDTAKQESITFALANIFSPNTHISPWPTWNL